MSDIQFGNGNQLYWLWLVAVAMSIALAMTIVNRRAIRRFASPELLPSLFPGWSAGRQVARVVLVTLVLVLLVLSLIDLRWGQVQREVPQKGIEVMFVLDVSRSMLAEDVAPNRLERAKQMIKDTLDEMAGDRVGLTVFSGETRQRIPLTSHYDDFKQTLDEVSPDDVMRGGSRLGDALLQAAEGFHGKTNRHKAIVLISDGEDQDSQPLRAARRVLEQHGARVFAIGIGDSVEGARIPVETNGRKTFLEHDGQQVWSKLNGEILEQIAVETGGAYVPAGTKQVSMADVYYGYITAVEKKEFETARINAFETRYQWFCALALMLAVIELTIQSRTDERFKIQPAYLDD